MLQVGHLLITAHTEDAAGGRPPLPPLHDAPGFLFLNQWRTATAFTIVSAWTSQADFIAFSQSLSPDDLLHPEGLNGALPWINAFEVKGLWGRMSHPEAVGEVLSASMRDTDPGMGPDWMEELSRIFDELALMPGFQGALIAQDISLPDRIIGLVRWDDLASFKRSVPDHETFYRLEVLTADADF